MPKMMLLRHKRENNSKSLQQMKKIFVFQKNIVLLQIDN